MATSLLAITKRMMRAYGLDVVMNRAVPDFRDGLKPVQRRAMWALKEEGAWARGSFYKVARISGATLKYHPHGSQNVSGAIVTMVNSATPLILGQGNYGSYNDPPGADRYIECKMSLLAEKLMLRSDYLNAVPMVPNYDGREIEPIYLPALFPNLLTNGGQGIAYGVTSNVPPMHPETIMPLIQACLRGETITSADVFKTLKFNWPYPSRCVSRDEDIMTWLENGQGPLYFEPAYEIDEKRKLINFLSVPPQFNFDNVMNDLEKQDWVVSVRDLLDKNSKTPAMIEVKIRTKRGVSNADDSDDNLDSDSDGGGGSDFDDKVQKVILRFTNTFACSTAIVTRSRTELSFNRKNIASYIHAWCDYRINLERDLQNYRISEFTTDIAKQDLLLLVIAHLPKVSVIIKESDKPTQALMALLKITEKEAASVLRFTLGQLTRMSTDSIHKEKQKLLKDKKIAEGWAAKPRPKVITDTNAILPLFGLTA